MTVFEQLEICILRQYLTDVGSVDSHNGTVEDFSVCVELVKLLVAGRFNDVLEAATKQIFNKSEKSPDILEGIKGFLSPCNDDDEHSKYSRQLIVLCLGVACLQLFVQNNWVGPLTDENVPEFLKKNEDTSLAASALSLDGEVIHPVVRCPEYLCAARDILAGCQDSLGLTLTSRWWLMRYAQTHQALLDIHSPTLKDIITEQVEKFATSDIVVKNEQYSDLAIEFHLEVGHLLYFYYEPRQAKHHFNEAEKLCGLDISLTGELGKRTRFQQKEISQLILNVSKIDGSQPWSAPIDHIPTNLPNNVSANDDTLLEKVKLSDEPTEPAVKISGTQQAVILGLCHRHRKNVEGSGKIVKEECLAYVHGALERGQSWSVQTSSMLMRAQWEHESSRLMQRSMSQLEELIAQVKRPEPEAAVRLPHVYCCKLPPVWEIQHQLALLYETVGAISAALEVYLRIQAWEDVIKCYTQTGKKEKANRLIREQLEEKETPLLWCYLGDVHDSVEYYQKAWELSEGRFGRAQRSLGYLYLHKKQYEESLPCFEKSLKANGLQIGVWFSYGCAALACSKYDVAAKAYRRCVNLDGDNFEAWCNLATAYIRNNQKSRAFAVLQEALKCEFENWRVWDNYMLVSTDIGEFQETIRAYHRLLDIRDKHTDTEVLAILVRGLKDKLTDAHDKPVIDLKPKILELFGRITSKITANAEIWRLYSEATSCSAEPLSQADKEKALQFLQKSHRCTTQAPNWEKEIEKCKEVLGQAVDFAKSYLHSSASLTDDSQACQMLGGARLMIKGVLAKVKQQQTDSITGELNPDVVESYQALEEQLATVVENIQSRKT